MKKYITLIIIAFASIAYGQSKKNFNQDSVVYLTDAQEAFMIDKETKYLIKAGPIGYEQKLSPSFSINSFIHPSNIQSALKIESGLELRYYYKLANLIKEGKQANNLSSEYIAVGIDYSTSPLDRFSNPDTYNYNIVWGSQKRFLNYGFLDYGLQLSYSNTTLETNEFNVGFNYNRVSLSTRSSIGFAFGKRYKVDDVVKCPIFKCNLDRQSALKLDFNRAFNISFGNNSFIGDNIFSALISPDISYEIKLGSSAFSINQQLSLSARFSTKISKANPNLGVSEYSIGYTAGVRHYFRLKSKIRKGKSGNNLSGVYWHASTAFLYGVTKRPSPPHIENPFEGKNRTGKYINMPIGIGYQKTVLNNFYFDFQTGLNLRVKKGGDPINYDSNYQSVNNDPEVYFDFKVGKMF